MDARSGKAKTGCFADVYFLVCSVEFLLDYTIRYDTIEEFVVDSKAEYSAFSSTRSQKKGN